MRQAMRSGGRGGQQPEQQQRPHGLRRLGCDDAKQRDEGDPEQACGHAPGRSHLGRDRGEQQRTGDRRRRQHGAEPDRRRQSRFAAAETEDRAEQRARAGHPRGAGRARAREREEERAEPEDEREGDADRRVVGRARARSTAGVPPARAATRQAATEHAATEHADRQAGSDRRDEQADSLIGAGRRRRQRPRKGHVAERIAREHLRAQHDEPATYATGERDERARQQRVAHELGAEHQAITPGGSPGAPIGVGSGSRA